MGHPKIAIESSVHGNAEQRIHAPYFFIQLTECLDKRCGLYSRRNDDIVLVLAFKRAGLVNIVERSAVIPLLIKYGRGIRNCIVLRKTQHLS